jgi:hypothetical protein
VGAAARAALVARRRRLRARHRWELKLPSRAQRGGSDSAPNAPSATATRALPTVRSAARLPAGDCESGDRARGNAARMVRAPMLCLCKRRNRRGSGRADAPRPRHRLVGGAGTLACPRQRKRRAIAEGRSRKAPGGFVSAYSAVGGRVRRGRAGRRGAAIPAGRPGPRQSSLGVMEPTGASLGMSNQGARRAAGRHDAAEDRATSRFRQTRRGRPGAAAVPAPGQLDTLVWRCARAPRGRRRGRG